MAQYPGMLVHDIKSALLNFHRDKFKVFSSFPLLSSDRTVMFTNATITPFKDMFLGIIPAENYAIVQQCFRYGGTTEIDCFGNNPYSLTAFEMFGSGLFNSNLVDSVSYLIEMLDLFGFKRNKCYFVTPPEAIYLKALQHNQIPSSQTFVLEKNSVFWQEWDFGHNGLTGKGYTVVIAKDKIPYSISEMETDHEQFIELLNLIHVFGRKEDGKITPIANPGVELGVGVERLAAAINNCDCYNIDTIKPITIAISDYLNSGGYQPNKSIIRTITDHLLSIFILSNEGIEPSNKSSGYILRKMIRKLITDIWLLAYSDFNFARLVDILFSTTGSYTDQSSKKVRAIIEKEVVAMQTILQTAKKIAHQHSELSIDHIHQTYGISPSIMTIARRERQK